MGMAQFLNFQSSGGNIGFNVLGIEVGPTEPLAAD
jgi:hypothetical protein